MKFWIMSALLIGLVAACTRENPVVVDSGQVQLAFDNVVGDKDLQLGSASYTNTWKEPFTVTTLNYYVTNIRLQRANGTEHVIPQDSSYFLVRESDPATQLITLRNVPAGEYTGLSYLLGVDSLRNTMDIGRRKGVLDPAGGHTGGMYWDWNSGYIHFKCEGTSAASADGSFLYHIGLFGGYQAQTLNNLRTVSLPFGQPILVATSQVPRVLIQANVLQLFDGPYQLKIAQQPMIMISPLSAGVANNYARLFRYVGQTVAKP